MELATHERKILGTMRRIRDREELRASDAGEDREEIGSLLELTGLNKKAFSFVRSLDRMADDKRNDVLRSLQPLLDLMQPHWDGGQKDWVDEATQSAEEAEAPQTREEIEASVAGLAPEGGSEEEDLPVILDGSGEELPEASDELREAPGITDLGSDAGTAEIAGDSEAFASHLAELAGNGFEASDEELGRQATRKRLRAGREAAA